MMMLLVMCTAAAE